MPEGITLDLVVVIGLAVAFDYINGFHDTANAIATSVSTRALAPAWAIAHERRRELHRRPRRRRGGEDGRLRARSTRTSSRRR